MIREPYSVYPYNTTIDTALTKNFSFVFNGGQLRSYDYEIMENNNKSNIIKSFDSLIPLENTVYNDTTVSVPVSLDNSMYDKNWIWRLRLVENKGDWTPGNIPTMKVQNGEILTKEEGKFTGIIAGTLENLTEKDLKEVCVSVKTNNSKYYKVTNYISNYFEYFYLAEGAYYLCTADYYNEHPKLCKEVPLYTASVYLTKYSTLEGKTEKEEQLTREKAHELFPDISGDPIVCSEYDVENRVAVDVEDGRELILFTKEEVDLMQDDEYGEYFISSFNDSPIELDNSQYFWAYKNFLDTNYYYFQSRQKPVLTFVDENNKELDINNGTFTLDGRYFSVGVKEQDSINTKYYKWTLYRNDENDPILETNKIFSQDIKFSYDNFVTDYSYCLVLTLETQDDAIYDYTIPNIYVQYDLSQILKAKSFAYYDSSQGCVNVSWPTQKLSIPDGEDFFVPDENWLDEEGVPEAGYLEGGELVYKDLSQEKIKIDPYNFIFSTCFAVNERIFRKTPGTFDIIKLQSDDGTQYLKIQKDNLGFKIMTSKTAKGIPFYEVKIQKNEDGSLVYTYDRNVFFQALNIENYFADEKPYVKEENLFNMFYLPDEMTDLYEDELNLYEADTDLNLTRYKLIFSAQGAFLCSYRKNSENKWVVNQTFVINNKDIQYHFDLKNAYFNQVILYPNVSFKYYTIYNLNNMEELILQLEEGIIDFEWEPTWENLVEEKILSVNFKDGVNSQYNIDIDGIIQAYRIYRYEYNDINKTEFISSKLLCETNIRDLTKINNNNNYLIKDYTAHNRGFFEYQITPRVDLETEDGIVTKVLGVAMKSDVIYINDYHWFFTSIGLQKDGTYRPVETWRFLLNLSTGDYNHNIQKVSHLGFGKYPKISIGTNNYITTSLSCLIGDFEYQPIKVYSGIIYQSGHTTRVSDINNLSRIYINECRELKNFNYEKDSAAISIRGQERKIINYGEEYINDKKYFFVDIYEKFNNFIPGLTNNYIEQRFQSNYYSLRIVKDKDNDSNYTKTGENRVYGNMKLPNDGLDNPFISKFNQQTESIHLINRWNDFISQDNLIIVKDLKGNCFICSLSDNSENYNTQIDAMPTTINFSITQIDAVDNYVIFGR